MLLYSPKNKPYRRRSANKMSEPSAFFKIEEIDWIRYNYMLFI